MTKMSTFFFFIRFCVAKPRSQDDVDSGNVKAIMINFLYLGYIQGLLPPPSVH